MSKENIDPTCDDIDLAKLVMSDCGCSTSYTALVDRIAARIARHVEKAVAYEREQCAKVCDSEAEVWRAYTRKEQEAATEACAAVIRARGQQ